MQYRKEFKDYDDRQTYIKQLKQEKNLEYGFVLKGNTLVKCNNFKELQSGLALSHSIGLEVTLVIQ